MSRPRLILLCDEAVTADVVVLRGYAGIGKTALLTDWGRRRVTEKVIWVSLNRATGLTAVDVWDGIARSVEQAGLEISGRGAASVAAAVNRSPDVVRIIVDDLDTGDLDIEAELVRCATLMKSGSLIVATRSGFAHSAEIIGVRASVAIIAAHDLAFTVEETEQLLREHSSSVTGLPRGLPDAAEVCRVTGGNALLTQLTLTSGKRDRQEIAELATGWIREALGDERTEQAAVLAIARVVDHGLAAHLTTAADAPMLLADLVREGWGDEDRAGYFRFHDLIALTLREHARSVLAPETVHKIRSRAADHLRQRPEQAATVFCLLAEAGRTAELWPFFAHNFVALMSDAHSISEVISHIPRRKILTDGTLAAIMAITRRLLSATSHAGMGDLVDIALAELRARSTTHDPDEMMLRELAVLALLITAERYVEAASHPAELERQIQSLGPDQRLELNPALDSAYLIASTTYALSGDMYGAERVLERAGTGRHGQGWQHRHIQHAYICAMRGEVNTAAAILDDHIEMRPHSALWSSRLTFTQAIIHLENGQVARANESLRALEPLMSTTPEWASVITVIARTHLALNPERGIEHVDRLLAGQASRACAPAVRDLLDSGVADLALAAGDIRRARELTNRRTRDDVALRVAAAQIGLVTGDLGFIDDIRDLLAQPNVWTRRRVHGLFVLAAGLYRAGRPIEASKSLRKALIIANEHGVRLIQSLVPRADLLAVAAQAGIELPSNVNHADPLASLRAPAQLTEREQVLLEHLATGALLREIADAEFVTLSTIKSQAASLYRKLGVNSRQPAINVAWQHGMID